jgi:hypothetical protein
LSIYLQAIARLNNSIFSRVDSILTSSVEKKVYRVSLTILESLISTIFYYSSLYERKLTQCRIKYTRSQSLQRLSPQRNESREEPQREIVSNQIPPITTFLLEGRFISTEVKVSTYQKPFFISSQSSEKRLPKRTFSDGIPLKDQSNGDAFLKLSYVKDKHTNQVIEVDSLYILGKRVLFSPYFQKGEYIFSKVNKTIEVCVYKEPRNCMAYRIIEKKENHDWTVWLVRANHLHTLERTTTLNETILEEVYLANEM